MGGSDTCSSNPISKINHLTRSIRFDEFIRIQAWRKAVEGCGGALLTWAYGEEFRESKREI